MTTACNKTRETLVVNLFAGPGAGKTTCAWEIASKLKKLGYVTEYVGEYAKELIWDGKGDFLNGTVKNQTVVYEEQKRRVDRLIGKVDFVVTDSPAILSVAYITEQDDAFEQRLHDDFFKYHNFCIFVERGRVFEQEGRIHNEAQSKALDLRIKNLLERNEIYYGTYIHSQIDLSIQNMQLTFQKINGKHKQTSLADKITKAQSQVKDTTKQPKQNKRSLDNER